MPSRSCRKLGRPWRGDRREVGAAVERPALGREEHRHRPAAAAGQRLDRAHVDLVEVGPLFAVDLDRDEALVQEGRGGLVLEGLALHDVAPVARRVADRQEDRPVEELRPGERVGTPREPIDGVVGVLEQVRAGLVRQPVRVPVGRGRLGHDSMVVGTLPGMGSAAVPDFLPSRHGFHFANRWPSTPAFWWGAGLVRLGLGDAGRGLCGGMAFAVRDRFEAGTAPPVDAAPPAAGTPLFDEIAHRQLDSFDRLIVVPFRFWQMSALAPDERLRASSAAWPAIRSEIDAGRLAMIGLVRAVGWNPLATGMGHQVAGYRYSESASGIAIGIYDPNHPDRDDVELTIERDSDGAVGLTQSTGEPLLGILSLPFVARR